MKDKIIQELKKIVKELVGENIEIELTIPTDPKNGDYATNIALVLSKKLGKNPIDVAVELVDRLKISQDKVQSTEKIQVAKPGFINFYLSKQYLLSNLENVLKNQEKLGKTEKMANKKIMVEFAHPNTHKEMHIGHMRTLITGESISRLLESQGAKVFRANYQGDIGPHVAKAMIGIQELMKQRKIDFDELEKWSFKDKAHFLGEGYVEGSKLYEDKAWENQIDLMNSFLYQKVEEVKVDSPFRPEEQEKIWNLYKETRKWSLDYYNEFYTRFYTKFDKLFMESEMVAQGKKIVKENVGKVFVQDEDSSIFFPGEKYGLHRRVFITKLGNPTYEGKEMANGFTEWEVSHFDYKIHVVANEQAGYFQVVFKALELLDPEKFKDKQFHLSMGMVQLVGKKMSSRTGEILTVDWLLDQIKEAANNLFKEGKLSGDERQKVLEQVTIAAVKYSVLKGGTGQNVVFDIEKSVSLDGNSGPYVQYAYTRTQSILSKSEVKPKYEILNTKYSLQNEEQIILRKLVQFGDVVEQAAEKYTPNILTEYLFELSQLFNNFYQKLRILNAEKEEEKEFRLALTNGVGVVLRQGLSLLGIEAPEKM